jgi:hypothetical protein
LGYVKKDVSNIRTMLREEITHRDMSLTVEYSEKRKAENPSFYLAPMVDCTIGNRATQNKKILALKPRSKLARRR